MNQYISAVCLALLATTTAPSFGAEQQGTPPDGQEQGQPALQRDAARPAKVDGKALPYVTINGSRASDMDQRRQSTAAKQIYGREELDRAGDSNLGDILKRLPGVTMGGRPGRGGEIRMRGLGSGYTQVLLNGERPPPGFSMDTLSPDQVERIEIMRGPVAEHSTQAIAGTINIVLREDYVQRDNQLKLTDSIEQGRHAPNIALMVPGKVGSLSYLMSATLFENHSQDQSVTRNQDVDSNGEVRKDQVVNDQSITRARGIHFTPRLSYKFDDGDTLNFQPFLMSVRSDGTSNSLLAQSAGLLPPDYASAEASTHASSTFLRGFGNWLHKLPGAAKLDVKFGFGSGHRDSETVRNQFDGNGVLRDRLLDTDATRDQSASSGGKYTTPLGRGHLLAAGWDLGWGHRTESRVSLDNGVPGFADSGDNLTAGTRRFAGFVQDEWDINPQWGTYFGLRWEGIQTTSTRAGADVSNESRVWSPLLHAVWHIPDHARDQARASVTRSYRAPTLTDLIALPSLSHLNSATKPDRTGNPDLKPELATGIDVAYEHYVGRSGIVSIGGFVRNIDDLMRRNTTLQATSSGPRWVSTPGNIGKARTSGIELEAKFQLVELIENAPGIEFRSNYSRFWSSVDSIPGPDNRLDGQARATANLGLDYHMKAWPLTLGGSYNWTPAVTVQTSSTSVVDGGAKRALDIYGLWKFNPRVQLRLSGNNLLGANYDSGTVVTSNGLAQMAEVTARTYTIWSAKLETRF